MLCSTCLTVMNCTVAPPCVKFHVQTLPAVTKWTKTTTMPKCSIMTSVIIPTIILWKCPHRLNFGTTCRCTEIQVYLFDWPNLATHHFPCSLLVICTCKWFCLKMDLRPVRADINATYISKKVMIEDRITVQ